MYKINYKIEGGLVVQIDEVVAESRALMSSFEDLHDSGLATGYVDTIPNNRVGHTMELHYINKALTASYTPIRGWVELATTTNTVSLRPQTLTSEQQAQVHTNIDTKSIADMAAKQLFIDLWNAAFYNDGLGIAGRYNSSTNLFEANGLKNITYAEAVAIYTQCNNRSGYVSGAGYGCTARTNISPFSGFWGGIKLSMFFSNSQVEILNFQGGLKADLLGCLNGNPKLTAINGAIDIIGNEIYSQYSSTLGNNPILTSMKIRGISKTLSSLKTSPALDKESLIYMLTNRSNSVTTTIVITYHHNVYSWASIDTEILSLLPAGKYASYEVGEVQLATV